MNTVQIRKYVDRDNRSNVFKGVFACDDMPRYVKNPSAYIINLATRSESGSHWVALYIDDEKSCYYFDSFGLPPTNRHIQAFIKKNAVHMVYNKKQLQHITSAKCGHYCCTFIKSILRNKPIVSFLMKFSTNLYINEIIIAHLFEYMK